MTDESDHICIAKLIESPGLDYKCQCAKCQGIKPIANDWGPDESMERMIKIAAEGTFGKPEEDKGDEPLLKVQE